MSVQGEWWSSLKQFTSARIALGRAGTALPTRHYLSFQADHAAAKDAVHTPLDIENLSEKLAQQNIKAANAESAAKSREEYLKRPDLGRMLSEPSVKHLSALPEKNYDLALVAADGLSALAVHEHALKFLLTFLPLVQDLKISPVILVKHGRVAISDQIGELIKARSVAILIGERPGLSSADSLGIYFTFQPRQGNTDEKRNCISNIRKEGLSYPVAAAKLNYLLRESLKRQLSGVMLREDENLLD